MPIGFTAMDNNISIENPGETSKSEAESDAEDRQEVVNETGGQKERVAVHEDEKGGDPWPSTTSFYTCRPIKEMSAKRNR